MLSEGFNHSVADGQNSPLSNRRILGPIFTGVKYFDAYVSGSGCVCSLDMVRLRLHFLGAESGQEWSSRACTFVHGDYSSYTSKVRPGGWHVLHVFDFGESSATVGVGFMDRGCKPDYSRGFLEFNPNKLAHDVGLGALLDFLRPYVTSCDLLRYDLAVDVPVSRNAVRLAKDRRKYRCDISDSMTEYLGRRDSGGYVKLYDKAAESGLDGVELSRVELTCDGSWGLPEVGRHWPVVYAPKFDAEGLGGIAAGLVRSLELHARYGESLEPYLVGIRKHSTLRDIRRSLCADSLVFPEDGAAHVLASACLWAGKLTC